MTEKEFKEKVDNLITKHIKESQELIEKLKKDGKLMPGLDGNSTEFHKLSQKQWLELKKLKEEYEKEKH